MVAADRQPVFKHWGAKPYPFHRKVKAGLQEKGHAPADAPHPVQEEAPGGQTAQAPACPGVHGNTRLSTAPTVAGMPTEAHHPGAQLFTHLFNHPSLVTPLVSGNRVTRRAQFLPSRMVKSNRRETPDTDQLASSCRNVHWLGLEPRGAVLLAEKATAQVLLSAALLDEPGNAAPGS